MPPVPPWYDSSLLFKGRAPPRARSAATASTVRWMMAPRKTSGGPLKAVLKEGVPACGSVGVELWSRPATASRRAVLAQTYLMERPIGNPPQQRGQGASGAPCLFAWATEDHCDLRCAMGTRDAIGIAPTANDLFRIWDQGVGKSIQHATRLRKPRCL